MGTFSLVENQFGDRYFHDINRGVFDRHGAKRIYDQEYINTLKAENSLLIIIGSDSGCLIEYLLNLGTAVGTRYIFIEPDDLADSIKNQKPHLQAYDDSSQSIMFVSETQWAKHIKNLDWISFIIREKMRCIQAFCAIDAFYPTYRSFTYDIEQTIVQLTWRVKGQLTAKNFITEQLHNLAYNRVPAKVLSQQFKNIPAFICAGGPSLDQHLDWIKHNRQCFLLLAVSRVAKRLLEVGITPDIIISVDPSERSFIVSREIFQFDPAPVFVTAYHAYHELGWAWPGEQVYLGPRAMWAEGEDNITMYGPTVTNAAIHLLTEMGVREIYLAGLDLCFSPEGFTHAKGSQEFEVGPAIGYLGQQVETNDGQRAQTDPTFFEGIQSIAKQAEFAATRGCQLINVSGQAAKIPQVNYQGLDRLSLPTLVCKISEQLKILTHLSPAQSIDNIKQMADQVRNAQVQLHDIHHTSQAILTQLAKSHLTQIDWQKINQAEAKFNTKHANILKMLKLFGYEYFIPLYEQQFILEEENETPEAIQSASIACFKGYSESSHALQPLVANALVSLNMAKEEINCHEKSIPNLLTYWESTSAANAWRLNKFNQFLEVKKTWQARIEKLVQQFDTKLSQAHAPLKQSPYVKHPKRTSMHKLLYEFNQKNVEELLALISQMKDYPIEDGQALLTLAYAYVAELNGHEEEAIQAYYLAAEDLTLQELALNHLAALLLKRRAFENAAQALDCLACVSPGYKPLAAQAWQALAEMKQAPLAQ